LLSADINANDLTERIESMRIVEVLQLMMVPVLFTLSEREKLI
jgi:hypothetical protein